VNCDYPRFISKITSCCYYSGSDCCSGSGYYSGSGCCSGPDYYFGSGYYSGFGCYSLFSPPNYQVFLNSFFKTPKIIHNK